MSDELYYPKTAEEWCLLVGNTANRNPTMRMEELIRPMMDSDGKFYCPLIVEGLMRNRVFATRTQEEAEKAIANGCTPVMDLKR